MMSTNLSSETEPAAAAWHAPRESLPSQVRADEPTLARWLGFAGLWLLTLGIVLRVFEAKGRSTGLTEFAWPLLSIAGLGGILYHALRDGDLQVRRTYGVIGYAWVLLGVALSVLPINGPVGAMFLPYGFVSLSLGLLFLMPYVRNESETNWHRTGLLVLGAVGLAMSLVGYVGGNFSENFLLPYSLLVILLGLFYLWAYVGLQGVESDRGFGVAQGIGVLGALALLVALARSAPELLYHWHWIRTHPPTYFVPTGLLLGGLGLVYLLLSIGFISDYRVVVLTRRELASMFCSPIAYIVLIGSTCIGWVMFYNFIRYTLLEAAGPFVDARPIPEPILAPYVFNFWGVIAVILIVPVLTMRTFSEEKRLGTMEVLLTAPVNESTIVIGKFLATLIFFFLSVLPWGLYLISLRIEGGQPFEYRPIITFFIGLMATGGGLLGMGLFFSSLTRNQVASALLTAAGVIGWTMTFMLKQYGPSGPLDNTRNAFLTQISFIDLWSTSIEGRVAPALLVFHVSLAVFWLFLTTKVLEARKWA